MKTFSRVLDARYSSFLRFPVAAFAEKAAFFTQKQRLNTKQPAVNQQLKRILKNIDKKFKNHN
ncbi:hypothetical protein JHJ32_03455 [Parapedobacter sp. ISTM3]|uniref:hypothetical protein n=1 Tax=Parapedobacter sp. ISTM3 TaxID=2800130 RepID=UPI0019082D6F|nr:hypothetical protein [Parapedobacter sp. ISTM3]MBK1439035.1 hypothetical protein [Parapedobacter sp. ISTM3]